MKSLDLFAKIRQTGMHFIRKRFAVFRRTTFHDVADEDLVTRKAHRLDNFSEQLAGAADKGKALLVFVISWTFANEHDLRRRGALAGHSPRPPLVQGAFGAHAHLLRNFFEAGGDIDPGALIDTGAETGVSLIATGAAAVPSRRTVSGSASTD